MQNFPESFLESSLESFLESFLERFLNGFQEGFLEIFLKRLLESFLESVEDREEAVVVLVEFFQDIFHRFSNLRQFQVLTGNRFEFRARGFNGDVQFCGV